MYYVLGLKLVQIFLTGYPKTINRPVPGYSIITAYKPNPPVTHHLQCRNDTCQALLRWGGGLFGNVNIKASVWSYIYAMCIYPPTSFLYTFRLLYFVNFRKPRSMLIYHYHTEVSPSAE